MRSALLSLPTPSALAPAYDACVRLARAHAENFPVASRALPASMRPHVAAVYAFARVADDFADEGTRALADRQQLLDAWQARLDAIADGRGADWPARGGEPADAPLIFDALAHSMATCRLPPSLFGDLLSAFRQDTIVSRYESWEALLDYCRRSANPVGRLVLRIAGVSDAEGDRAADAVCTALQLTNFWQDLARDWQKRRLYVPLDLVTACGASTDDLDRGTLSPPWRAALTEAARRTHDLFRQGRRVCDAVGGRLRCELRLTWLGGTRILEQLERRRFDVFADRPTLGIADGPVLLWRLITWRQT